MSYTNFKINTNNRELIEKLLNKSSNDENTASNTNESDSNKNFHNVKRIKSHIQIMNDVTKLSVWKFLVEWEDGNSDWIKDVDCKCENLISEYLKNNVPHVKTIFNFTRMSKISQKDKKNVSLEEQFILNMDYIIKNKLHKEFERIKTYKVLKGAYNKCSDELLGIFDGIRDKDRIIVYKCDRIFRNIETFVMEFNSICNKDIDIISTEENISVKNNKIQFMKNILKAQEESQNIGKRIRISNLEKRLGPCKYGYKYDIIDSKEVLTIDDTEKNIIMQIKHSKHDCEYLSSYYNNEKLYNRGKPWTENTIQYIRDNYDMELLKIIPIKN